MFWLIPIALGVTALIAASSSDDSSSSSTRDDSLEREEAAAQRAKEAKKLQLRTEIAGFYNSELKKLAVKLGNAKYIPSFSFEKVVEAAKHSPCISKNTQAQMMADSQLISLQKNTDTINAQLLELLELEKTCVLAQQHLNTAKTGRLS
jgi:hypothetical protein